MGRAPLPVTSACNGASESGDGEHAARDLVSDGSGAPGFIARAGARTCTACTTCEAEYARHFGEPCHAPLPRSRWASTLHRRRITLTPSQRVSPSNSARPWRPHAHRLPTARPHALIWAAGGSISRTRGNQSRRDKDGGHGGRTSRPESHASRSWPRRPSSSRTSRHRDSGRDSRRDNSDMMRA